MVAVVAEAGREMIISSSIDLLERKNPCLYLWDVENKQS